ncbi:MAG: hypothetical protein ABI679_11840 [Gemmatimonadota bacterium]
MHPDLTKLLELQARDIELADVDTRLTELDTEAAGLDEVLGKAREAVTAAIRAIEVEKKKRDELEVKVEAHRKHQEKRKEKLEFMKTPKEVAALMAEIDLARSALGNEENDWIRSSDQVTALEARRTQAEEGVKNIQKEQAVERQGLDDRRAVLDTERAAAATRREASASTVRKQLLQRYDKLRLSANRRSVVVVPLNGPACGACFTAVPLARRTIIKTGEAIEGCESCGVILYFAE